MALHKSVLLYLSLMALVACKTEHQNMSNSINLSECETEDTSLNDLRAMKLDKFVGLSKSNSYIIAQALLKCVGHPNPTIRDGLVFETVTHILRSNLVTIEQVKDLKTGLLNALNSPGSEGFGQPFAALLLSEIARVDRISSFLTEDERTEFVQRAATYVINVNDYRGYSDDDGWRHGVAHGADWLMQLALNPNITSADKTLIRDAVASQLMPHQHSYIFGEPERLSRPILFLAASQSYSEEEWADWLRTISNPSPLDSWGEAFTSENHLARLHNIKAFINAIYINASVSGNDGVKMLRSGSLDVLRTLP